MIYALDDIQPRIDPTAWVAADANIIGRTVPEAKATNHFWRDIGVPGALPRGCGAYDSRASLSTSSIMMPCRAAWLRNSRSTIWWFGKGGAITRNVPR